MRKRVFAFNNEVLTIKADIDLEKDALVLALSYADGFETELSIKDGMGSESVSSRYFMDYIKERIWFFSKETRVVFEGDNRVCLRAPLHAAGFRGSVDIYYEFVFNPENSAMKVTTWFGEGGFAPVFSLNWLDISVDISAFPSFFGCMPEWEGRTKEMKEPLAFFDAAALYGCYGMLGVGGVGKTLISAGKEKIRLMPFYELGNFNGNACCFDKDSRLSAWLIFAPWKGSKDFLDKIKALEALFTQSKITEPPDARELTLKSGDLHASLIVTHNSAYLKSVGRRDAEACFLTPLFYITLRDLRDGLLYQLSSSEAWREVRVKQLPGYAELTFAEPKLREFMGGIYVTVRCENIPEKNRMQWYVDVINDNPCVSVLSCDYPNVRIYGRGWNMLLPKASGVLSKNCCCQGDYLSASYPGFTIGMPFFAAYCCDAEENNGLYIGVHDPEGCRKDMHYLALPDSRSVKIRFEYPAQGFGCGANSFSLPGYMTWQLFTGDWYDAALIYRDFLRRYARWLAAPKDSGRPDSPQWFREIPFWIMDWMPNGNPDKEPVPVSVRPEKEPAGDDWINIPVRLRRALGVPVGYHIYNWHYIPFNNDFPHYFPAEEGFEEGVKKLQSEGIRVMPYINGRLWDILDKKGEDWRFSRDALPSAVKDDKGRLMTESYASHEPDGSLCRLAVMCPSTPRWRETLQQITDTLFKQVGVDAVYVDQVAAAQQSLCCDPGHNHFPGGGAWWTRSYQELMRRLNLGKPDQRAFTTECNGEPYAGSFDGFLTWHWIQAHQVPVFPVLYAGNIAMIGRNLNGYKKNDIPYFKFHIAEQLLFGQQIGWINSDVVNNEKKFPFLKKMVALRWDYRELFATGRPLRPPVIHTDASVIPSFAGMGRPIAWEVFGIEPVRSALWQDNKKERCVFFAVNTGDSKTKCEFNVLLNECKVSEAESIKAVKYDGAGELNSSIVDNILKLSCVLEPEGYLVLEWPCS